jgi:hypothetical protein
VAYGSVWSVLRRASCKEGNDCLVGSLSFSDVRRESGGDMYPVLAGGALAAEDGYEYGGGGPGYMVVGLTGAVADMLWAEPEESRCC